MSELEKAIAMLAENQVKMTQTLEAIAAQAPKQEIPESVKVIQINTDGKRYFCKTSEEQEIFFENNPQALKYICDDCGERFDIPSVAEGQIYICTKCNSKSIHVNTESFNYELPVFVAEKYLEDPNNKKQFTRKQFTKKG